MIRFAFSVAVALAPAALAEGRFELQSLAVDGNVPEQLRLAAKKKISASRA